MLLLSAAIRHLLLPPTSPDDQRSRNSFKSKTKNQRVKHTIKDGVKFELLIYLFYFCIELLVDVVKLDGCGIGMCFEIFCSVKVPKNMK